MKYLVLLLALFAFPIQANASWHAGSTLSFSNEENVFLSSIPEDDVVTTTSIWLGHLIEHHSWVAKIMYEGSFIEFWENNENNYQLHNANLTVQHQLPRKGWWKIGLGAENRLDGDTSGVYNHVNYLGALDTKVWLKEKMFLLAGYNIGKMRYTDLAEWNNIEHQLYSKLQFMPSSKTTMTLASDISLRHYLSPLVSATTPEGTVEKSVRNTGQWVNSLALSTPLFDDHTGLQAFVLSRSNFGDKSSQFSLLDTELNALNPFFDDRYEYSSREYGSILSRVLPFTIMTRIGYNFASKDYNEISGTSEPRHDTLHSLWLRIEKTFGVHSNDRRLKLFSECQQLWNNSSNNEFDYSAWKTEFGAELTF